MSNRKKKKSKRGGYSRKRRSERFDFSAWLNKNKCILILVVIGSLLRLIDLGRQSLWIDEICCWRDSLASYKRIFSTGHWVVFILERLSFSLGWKHEFFLRLPSALAGIMVLALF